jgi:hypothetical protein
MPSLGCFRQGNYGLIKEYDYIKELKLDDD